MEYKNTHPQLTTKFPQSVVDDQFPHVSRITGRLDELNGKLDLIRQSLKSRLAPVLAPEGPEAPPKTGNSVAPAVCPLLDQIDVHLDDAENQLSEITKILSRVAL